MIEIFAKSGNSESNPEAGILIHVFAGLTRDPAYFACKRKKKAAGPRIRSGETRGRKERQQITQNRSFAVSSRDPEIGQAAIAAPTTKADLLQTTPFRTSQLRRPGLDPGSHLPSTSAMDREASGGWVYIMADCYRGTMYVGVTADLAARVSQHREGAMPSCKRTGSLTCIFAKSGNSETDPIPVIERWGRRELSLLIILVCWCVNAGNGR